MTTLPTELISLVGSSFFAALMKIWGKTVETRKMERLMLISSAQAQHPLYQDLRNIKSPGFQWTRRVIALLAVFFIIVFPKLMSIWHPEILISIGYPEWSDGFLFTSSCDKVKWVSMHGLVITPLDTHLVSAIIGLYFGGALVR
ncbi:MAG TPA: hypothetical protein DHV51_02465 [Opitutae bacterium]|nr:hypothetical protein [Opitutae bacterium]